MKLNRFRLNIILRIILITFTVVLAVLLSQYYQFYYGLVIVVFVLVYEVYSLFLFVDKTNVELARFLNSVKYSDTSQSYISKNFGKSFDGLFSVFRELTNNISESKSEQEVGHLYLQTIIKHIAIGLITYRKDGEVELINNAARKLLNVQSLKNIYHLGSNNGELLGILSTIKAGDRTLVKVGSNAGSKVLSIFAAEFKLRDREFILVSLQDIKNELERERLASELEIAHQVQLKLLPDEIPAVEGYSFAAICEPAREVGGDYYDFIKIGKNKIGVVIGDVAGKGLPAAIYMTLVKGIFQSVAGNSFSPRELLSNMNKLVYQIIEKGLFVTMFYGIIDIRNKKFTFARAGHEAPIFFNTNNGEVQSLRPVGMALGFDSGEKFDPNIEEITLDLNSGDTIVLYTDGYTEANNRLNEEYGKERMQEFIKENRSLETSKFLHLLNEDVKNFCQGTEQFDDMTSIIIRKTS